MGESVFLLLKLLPLFGPFLIGLVGVGINCYSAHRNLEEVMNNFKNSHVMNYYGGVFESRSFFSRWILASIVSSGVAWPNKHIRNGTLDSEELDRLPSYLKFRMKLSVGLMLFGYGGLAVVVFVGELFK